MKRTPLYQKHLQLGAKMIEFGGWEMPIQFRSIIAEHQTVRSNVGIFDLSHMGQIEIRGENAFTFVQKIITNDAKKLVDGKAIYSPICYENGGIVDDLIVNRVLSDRYMLIVNAANIEKDLEWFRDHNSENVEIKNLSDEISLIAVQGPNSINALQPLTEINISKIRSFRFINGEIGGVYATVSRTGYTGEIGFELYVEAKSATKLWDAVYQSVTDLGGEPIGLGARDTLRLEATFSLYGNEIDHTTTPLEAGLGWTVKFEKGNFIGCKALQDQKQNGIDRKLIGFEMLDRSVARSGYSVICDDREIGKVTSGSPSPTLGKNIGLAYVPIEFSEIGTEIEMQIRRRKHSAKIIKTPFLK